LYAVEDLELNISVYNEYVHFEGVYDFLSRDWYCIIACVIHHLGDDFGDKSLLWKKAKEKMKGGINYFIQNGISSFTNGILLERR
jgi:hypothetical protein